MVKPVAIIVHITIDWLYLLIEVLPKDVFLQENMGFKNAPCYLNCGTESYSFQLQQ